MSWPVRVFVDGRPLEVRAATTVLTAVAAGDPELAAALQTGRAYVTDGVGRPIDPGTAVLPGAILRVVRTARRKRAD